MRHSRPGTPLWNPNQALRRSPESSPTPFFRICELIQSCGIFSASGDEESRTLVFSKSCASLDRNCFVLWSRSGPGRIRSCPMSMMHFDDEPVGTLHPLDL